METLCFLPGAAPDCAPAPHSARYTRSLAANWQNWTEQQGTSLQRRSLWRTRNFLSMRRPSAI